ncbi:MAG: MOSC domain-containing protein [Gemmatimonadaceae bacterium]
MPGRVEKIWIKRSKGGVMDAVQRATLCENKGIVGNANQGGRRQVTILERERWEAHLEALHASLDPSRRRANILISGCSLSNTRNQILKIGNVRFRIAGETKPCNQMEGALPGLEKVMRPEWGGGAFAMVLDDGEIRVGDELEWVENSEPLSLFQKLVG